MLAGIVRPDRYKENVILCDCNVACLQLFPGFKVIGPQIMHVFDVSGSESLIFNLVEGEELPQLLSGLEISSRSAFRVAMTKNRI